MVICNECGYEIATEEVAFDFKGRIVCETCMDKLMEEEKWNREVNLEEIENGLYIEPYDLQDF